MPALYQKTNNFISQEVKAKPKRIAICCDGTWQSATSLDPNKACTSNVIRLARVIANAGNDENGQEWQQIVYYDAGIGTGDLTTVDKSVQGGLGKGLIENVLEAYNFIVNNYSAGDQLFFFGFSRGAYTVRATAGLICELGILRPAFIPAFMEHYNDYIQSKDSKPVRFEQYKPWADYLQENKGKVIKIADKVDVQVIGVWDTVGSLGVPDLGHFWTWHKADTKAYQFHDTNINDQILNAFQALALDERRSAFAPAVWKLKPGSKTNMCQCWFTGAHVNVGGGNSENAGKYPKGDREQLSSVAFGWMLDRIRPHIAISESALDAQLQEFKRLADAPTAPEEWSLWNAAAGVKNLLWKSAVKIAPYGYALGDVNNSYKGIYKIMGAPKEREPNFNDNSDSDVPVSEREFTVEEVHPSVYYRQQTYLKLGLDPYTPVPMQGWKRIKASGQGAGGFPREGWKWVKYSEKNDVINELWEFQISDRPESIEVRMIGASPVKWVYDEERKK